METYKTQWKCSFAYIQVPLLLLPSAKPSVSIACVSLPEFLYVYKAKYEIFSPSCLFIQKKVSNLDLQFSFYLSWQTFHINTERIFILLTQLYSVLLIASTILNLAGPELKVIWILSITCNDKLCCSDLLYTYVFAHIKENVKVVFK